MPSSSQTIPHDLEEAAGYQYNPLYSDADSISDDMDSDDVFDNSGFSYLNFIKELGYDPDNSAFTHESFLDGVGYDPIHVFDTTVDIFSTWTMEELETARTQLLRRCPDVDKVNGAYSYLKYVLTLHFKYGFEVSSFFTRDLSSTRFQDAPEKLLEEQTAAPHWQMVPEPEVQISGETGKKRKRTICEDLSEVEDRLRTIHEDMKSLQEARVAVKNARTFVAEEEKSSTQLHQNVTKGESKLARLQQDMSRLQQQFREESQKVENYRRDIIATKTMIESRREEVERWEKVLATLENGQEDQTVQTSTLRTLQNMVGDISKLID